MSLCWHVALALLLVYVVANVVVRVLLNYANGHKRLAMTLNGETPMDLAGGGGVREIAKLAVAVTYSVFVNSLIKAVLVVIAVYRFWTFSESAQFEEYLLSPAHAARTAPKDEAVVARKTVLLIRHGESMWNMAFNASLDRSLLPRVFKFVLSEVLLGCDDDSVILDSPLSALGIDQARKLSDWIELSGKGSKDATAQLLLAGPITVCTSNLRRATSTCLLGMSARWQKADIGDERVLVMRGLAESTANPDGVPICAASELLGRKRRSWADIDKKHMTLSNKKYNLGAGFARLKGAELELAEEDEHAKRSGCAQNRLLRRLRMFCDFAVGAPGVAVVAFGHSCWIRRFFQAFCPPGKQATSPWSYTKLNNCGILQLELIKYCRSDGSHDFWVNPDKVSLVYNGE